MDKVNYNKKELVTIQYFVILVDLPTFCKGQGGESNATIAATCANFTSAFTTEANPFDSLNGS